MRNSLIRKAGLVAALAGLLAGCEYFDDEDRLEGERIAIRDQVTRPDRGGIAPAEPLPVPVRNTDWTQTNGRSSHASGNLVAPATLSLAWSADAGVGSSSEGSITSRPIVLGGRIYTLDAEAELSAFDTASGTLAWRVELTPEGEDGEDGFGGGLAAEGNTIFATTGFGEVLALSAASGEIIWRHRAAAPFRSAPAVASSTVVAVTRDNVAIALSADTGEVVWRIAGITAGAGLLGGASPAIQGQLVVVPFASGEVMGVQLGSGRQAWSAVLGGSRRGLARAAISDVTGDPVIAGRIVVAGNQSGRTAAIDGQSGRRGWTRAVGAIGPIWAAGQSIYVVTDAAEVMRLSLRTGQTIWHTQLPAFEDEEDREDPIAYSGPVLAGGRILVTSSLGALLSFDAETGEQGEEVEISDGSTLGVTVAAGQVFVLSENGILQAFR